MFKQFLVSEANKSGTCAYCHKHFRKLTKEHVIPKMFGGTYTIKTCRRCNQSRGHSFTYAPFRKWARAHPNELQKAIQDAIRNNPSGKKTLIMKTANI
tara:strand:- start:594 stop:887 length:294 start_codon:yes stop_codon:yes gene_type:complete